MRGNAIVLGIGNIEHGVVLCQRHHYLMVNMVNVFGVFGHVRALGSKIGKKSGENVR